MKKLKVIAAMLAATLLLTAAGISAQAEDNSTSVTAGQTAKTENTAAKNGRPGQMPGSSGRNGQQGQMPGNNGQNSQQGQIPGSSGRNGPQGQMPGNGGKDMPHMPGNNDQKGTQTPGTNDTDSDATGTDAQTGTPAAPGSVKPADVPAIPNRQAPLPVDFDAMVIDGVISQETCDKIKEYMESHKPSDLPRTGFSQANNEQPADGQTTPEEPAGSQTAPEKPEGDQSSEQPESGGLLAELLKEGIITHAEYDAMTTVKANT